MAVTGLYLFMMSGLILFFLSFKSSNMPREDQPSAEALCTLQRKLYHFLKLNGYTVELFQACGRYTMAMTLPHYRIAIECPNKVVPFPTYEDKAFSKKEVYLANRGWVILRFSSSMIQHHPHRVLRRIEDKIFESQVP